MFFVVMKVSKSINYSTAACWSCQWTTTVMGTLVLRHKIVQYFFLSLWSSYGWSPLWLHHKIGKKKTHWGRATNQLCLWEGGWFPYTVHLTIYDEVPILIPGSYRVWLSNLAALLAYRTISISKLWEVV